MPNPEDIIEAAELGADVLGDDAPRLPGLIELSDKGISETASLLEPANRALVLEASLATNNPFFVLGLDSAARSDVPLGVDVGKITALRQALEQGSPTDISDSLSNVFRPRTYAEKLNFYGG